MGCVPHIMGYVYLAYMYPNAVSTCISQYSGTCFPQYGAYIFLTKGYRVQGTHTVYMCPVLWDACTVRYFGLHGSCSYTYPTVKGTCTIQFRLHVPQSMGYVYFTILGTCIPMYNVIGICVNISQNSGMCIPQCGYVYPAVWYTRTKYIL